MNIENSIYLYPSRSFCSTEVLVNFRHYFKTGKFTDKALMSFSYLETLPFELPVQNTHSHYEVCPTPTNIYQISPSNYRACKTEYFKTCTLYVHHQDTEQQKNYLTVMT